MLAFQNIIVHKPYTRRYVGRKSTRTLLMGTHITARRYLHGITYKHGPGLVRCDCTLKVTIRVRHSHRDCWYLRDKFKPRTPPFPHIPTSYWLTRSRAESSFTKQTLFWFLGRLPKHQWLLFGLIVQNWFVRCLQGRHCCWLYEIRFDGRFGSLELQTFWQIIIVSTWDMITVRKSEIATISEKC